jgi:YidC/Oxa1 family membrane protein insertase
VLALPYHLVLFLADALTGAGAIVLLTLLVRAALLPLSIRAAKANRAAAKANRAAAKTRAASLEKAKEHANDPEKLAELAGQQLRGLTAGLVPMLVQMPFFMVLYRLFNASTVDGGPNELLQHGLLGVHLGTRFLTDPGQPVFFAVFFAVALIAWYAGRRTKGILKVLPFLTMLVAAWVPLAGSVYLVASTAWTAVERRILYRDDDPTPALSSG